LKDLELFTNSLAFAPGVLVALSRKRENSASHKKLAFTPVFSIIAAIFRPNRIPKGVLARPDIPRDLSGERPSKSDARSRVAACLKRRVLFLGISPLVLM
jgi:hypothetical protein